MRRKQRPRESRVQCRESGIKVKWRRESGIGVNGRSCRPLDLRSQGFRGRGKEICLCLGEILNSQVGSMTHVHITWLSISAGGAWVSARLGIRNIFLKLIYIYEEKNLLREAKPHFIQFFMSMGRDRNCHPYSFVICPTIFNHSLTIRHWNGCPAHSKGGINVQGERVYTKKNKNKNWTWSP